MLLSVYILYAYLESHALRQSQMKDYFNEVEELFRQDHIDYHERQLLRQKYLERYWKQLCN